MTVDANPDTSIRAIDTWNCALRLGYVILYVPDVAAALAFYNRAFGLKTRFIAPGDDYGELETGGTALAFAAEALIGSQNVVFRANRPDGEPAGVEVGLVAEDVAGAYAAAVAAGAAPLHPPRRKPWGQSVAYVRDCNGFLVELCSQMA